MKGRRKLYYVPGMISLILLPILCYNYLRQFKKDERCKEVVFCSRYSPQYKGMMRFDTSFLSRPKTKRAWQIVELNGIETEDDSKLAMFRLRVREMIKQKDSIHGIHLLFLENAKYGSFIKSLDICEQEGLLIYAAFENNLWALYLNWDEESLKKIKKRKKERLAENNAEIMERKNRDASNSSIGLNDILKVWPVLAILVLLSFVSLRKVVRLKRS